jgi:bifunctional DNA-binding transcriptional regulator/antitoxin component of YhaV-PrlF toxin-antitoxin module
MARGFKEKRQKPYASKAPAAAKAAPGSPEPARPAPLRARVTLGPGGRFVIPKKLRAAMEVAVGEPLSMEVVDGELHVRGFKVGVRKVQEMFAPYRIPGVSAVDELIAERRREFDLEERKMAEDRRNAERFAKRRG